MKNRSLRPGSPPRAGHVQSIPPPNPPTPPLSIPGHGRAQVDRPTRPTGRSQPDPPRPAPRDRQLASPPRHAPRPARQPAGHPVGQSVSRPTDRPTNQPTNQPASQPPAGPPPAGHACVPQAPCHCLWSAVAARRRSGPVWPGSPASYRSTDLDREAIVRANVPGSESDPWGAHPESRPKSARQLAGPAGPHPQAIRPAGHRGAIGWPCEGTTRRTERRPSTAKGGPPARQLENVINFAPADAGCTSPPPPGRRSSRLAPRDALQGLAPETTAATNWRGESTLAVQSMCGRTTGLLPQSQPAGPRLALRLERPIRPSPVANWPILLFGGKERDERGRSPRPPLQAPGAAGPVDGEV